MKLIAALLVFLLAGALRAEPPSSAQLEAINRLDFLVGDWEGAGWVVTPDGKRETFSSTETIRKKLLGTALLIEGTHTGFEALAVVTFDTKAQQYRWRSFTSLGRGADVEARIVGAQTLQWFPSAHSRYTIKISDSGKWEEIGEYSQDDGKTWTQFFEMRLQRVQP